MVYTGTGAYFESNSCQYMLEKFKMRKLKKISRVFRSAFLFAQLKQILFFSASDPEDPGRKSLHFHALRGRGMRILVGQWTVGQNISVRQKVYFLRMYIIIIEGIKKRQQTLIR